jgi:hypothetical protein
MAATLSAVQATFHAVAPKAPADEIEITVTDSAGEIVAQDTNNYGVFPAGSTNGPYGIEVLNQVDKTTLHPGGNVTINTPSPAAPWAANIRVELIFSDTSKLLVNENGVALAGGGALVFGL